MQRKELQSFLRTLRRARRALANVPTMMMFDDHEISDDWNLDGPWFDNSRDNPAQHRVVRNGLLAYAVFQAWGNEPARFASGVPNNLLDVVTVPTAATASPAITSPSIADVPLNLTQIQPGERMTWNWTLPGSEHLIVALDSRTGRDYTSIDELTPGLLTPAELDRQLTAHVPPPDGSDTRLRFVIAPGPVVGHPFVEGIQSIKALYETYQSRDMIKGGRVADLEAWCVNRITYQSVLRRLADFGRVVLLSGDVHYAYTNQTAYFGAHGQAPARIVQLCSSSAKNAESMTRLVQRLGLVSRQGESWLGLGTPLPEPLKNQLRGELGYGTAAVMTPWQKSLLDRVTIFRLLETPVIPMKGWRNPEIQDEIANLADRGNPADWRYKTTFIFDARNGAQRLGTALELNPTTPSFAALHVAKQAHKVVVGEPNVGQVWIRDGGDGRDRVVHRLHWLTSADPKQAAHTCTEHQAPLYRPGPDERPQP